MDTRSRLHILQDLPAALAIVDFSKARQLSAQSDLRPVETYDEVLAALCELIRVLDVNPALCELLDLARTMHLREEVVRELLVTDARENLLPFLVAEKTPGRFEFETVAKRESGEDLEVLITLVAAGEEEDLFLCLVSDQTEHHRLRQLAEMYRTQLEYSIEARNREIAGSPTGFADVEFNC